ncbi:hypothetical protein BD324DRAFT_578376 [Kockovaella imperatae]|uniref:NAD-dependent epimerase/dehydratase domain-containing protein n=1 Tax=Kockovaella imperatae TaxID=4999 RepID=A0A1Y1UI59_9TREE|nr:hypothetical protein BD324DRAFT_578376 [Kockovaella imperatae]ORX37740.1 hypothetical protein BD324DRAFT_578376 [Kockovaella imperatae]
MSQSQAASFTQDVTLGEKNLTDPSLPSAPRKKRVVVTGGSGKLGRWVVREMVEHGWQVLNLDKSAPAPSEKDVPARFIIADLTNYGEVIALLSELDAAYRGIDAVIHLAALPAPGMAANHVIFHTNVTQTYNVLEAARVLRIQNIALASSETVFGIPLNPHLPTKLPLTEEVERPESSYSLSKLLGEKMSEQFCRWDPELKIINIRLSNVIPPEDYGKFQTWQDDPWTRSWNGFGYIDPRDCAQAFRLSLEKPLKGTHVFNIANADSTYTAPTADLVKKVFPTVQYTAETDNPRESLISIKKAREVLGYEPKYDWQSEITKLQGHKNAA